MGWLLWMWFFLLQVSFSLSAWDKIPHMVVTSVAEHYMSPKTKRSVGLLSAAFDLEYKGFDSIHAIAVWQNDPVVRKHFPLLQRAYYSVLKAEDYPFGDKNSMNENLAAVVFAGIEAVFAGEGGAHVYSSTVIEKLLNFALLLHYTAEVHYPFSVVGSFEGKSLRDFSSLEVVAPWSKMEALWSCAGCLEMQSTAPQKQKVPAAPSSEEVQAAHEIALQLVEEFGGTECEEMACETDDPREWAKETAKVFCELHKEFPPTETPTEEYKERVQELSRKQLFLAGFRLAERMNAGAKKAW